MASSQAEVRILRELHARVPSVQAKRIFRRGFRIASLLSGGRPDDETLRSVCDALAQEGSAVQEIVEELVSRQLEGLASARTRPRNPKDRPK